VSSFTFKRSFAANKAKIYDTLAVYLEK